MPVAESRRSLDELAQLGTEIFEFKIVPSIRIEDDGKFVAVDVGTGEFEIDEDDYVAVMRLRNRIPDSEIWLARAGSPATCRIRRVR